MKKLKCVNGTALKLLAMALMLCDHIWASGVLNLQWLTVIGRLAFPIFAFQIAEGYANTHDFKKYLLRMLLFAAVSEIPFDLMVGESFLHQNVMFTFVLALLMLRWLDNGWQRQFALWQRAVMLLGVCLTGYLLGFVTFVDYYGYGILMVLLFWVTRERKWGWVMQLLGMIVLNFAMEGASFVFHVGGAELWVPQQAFAILALIPIWLYNGKRGPGGKVMQYFGYAFYPAHLLLLYLIGLTMGY